MSGSAAAANFPQGPSVQRHEEQPVAKKEVTHKTAEETGKELEPLPTKTSPKLGMAAVIVSLAGKVRNLAATVVESASSALSSPINKVKEGIGKAAVSIGAQRKMQAAAARAALQPKPPTTLSPRAAPQTTVKPKAPETVSPRVAGQTTVKPKAPETLSPRAAAKLPVPPKPLSTLSPQAAIQRTSAGDQMSAPPNKALRTRPLSQGYTRAEMKEMQKEIAPELKKVAENLESSKPMQRRQASMQAMSVAEKAGPGIKASEAQKLIEDSSKAIQTYNNLKNKEAKGGFKRELSDQINQVAILLEKKKSELLLARSDDPMTQNLLSGKLSEIRALTDSGELAKNKLDIFQFKFDDILKDYLAIQSTKNDLAKEKAGYAMNNLSDKQKASLLSKEEGIKRREGTVKEREKELREFFPQVENMVILDPQMNARHQEYVSDYRNFSLASDRVSFADQWKEEHKTVEQCKGGQISQNTTIFADGLPYRSVLDTSTWEKANKTLQKRDPTNAANIQKFSNQVKEMGRLYSDSVPKLKDYFTKEGSVEIRGEKSENQLRETLQYIKKMQADMENIKASTAGIVFEKTELSEAPDIGKQYLLQTIENGLNRLAQLDTFLSRIIELEYS